MLAKDSIGEPMQQVGSFPDTILEGDHLPDAGRAVDALVGIGHHHLQVRGQKLLSGEPAETLYKLHSKGLDAIQMMAVGEENGPVTTTDPVSWIEHINVQAVDGLAPAE